MRLGAVSSGLLHLEFEDGLDLLRDIGATAVEIACAGFFKNLRYGDPSLLARDAGERERWAQAIAARGLQISAFAIHGQPLAPDPEIARAYDREFRTVCELAEAVGVSRVTLFAGLPEGRRGDRTPCWVVSAWPPENAEVLRYQWEERVLPYWLEHAAIARSHGVRLCFEMHPSDVLYQPRALLRLREHVGVTVGCNFDPSHLFWQGIDPLEAMRTLGEAIYHVHAKDTRVSSRHTRVNGILDTTPFQDYPSRSWSFRTVGFGHGELFWRDFVSELRAIGYDDVISIEHEDFYVDLTEGMEKAATLLRSLIFKRPAGRSSFDLSGERVDPFDRRSGGADRVVRTTTPSP